MDGLKIPTFEDIVYNLCRPENKEIIKDSLDLLTSHNILQEFENNVIKAYGQIAQATNSTPSIALLQQSVPQFRYQGTDEVVELFKSIQLFVQDRLNKQASAQLIEVAGEIAKTGVTEKVVDKLESLTKTDANIITYVNPIETIRDEANKRVDKTGIRFDTRKIDDYIGGLKPGQLTTIAAFTGGGKTTFSVCAMHSAIKQGYNVCYLSLEVPSAHLVYDIISRHTVDNGEDGRPKFRKPVEHGAMKNNTVANGDWDYLFNEVLEDLKQQPGKFYILDEQDLPAKTQYAFNNKLQEVENIAIEETGHGIDLLIVDHIQMLQYADTSNNSPNNVINKWVNYFRSQCLDFLKSKRQIHVLMCAQINREGYKRAAKHDGMYDLTCLKEANEIETASSIIITLYSDPILAESKEIKFSIIKNRDGLRTEAAEPISCDLAHEVIGGDGITSDQQFASMTMEDLVNANNSDVDVSKVQQQQEMTLFGDDDLPW